MAKSSRSRTEEEIECRVDTAGYRIYIINGNFSPSLILKRNPDILIFEGGEARNKIYSNRRGGGVKPQHMFCKIF